MKPREKVLFTFSGIVPLPAGQAETWQKWLSKLVISGGTSKLKLTKGFLRVSRSPCRLDFLDSNLHVPLPNPFCLGSCKSGTFGIPSYIHGRTPKVKYSQRTLQRNG